MNGFLEEMRKGSLGRLEEARRRRPLGSTIADASDMRPSRGLGLFAEVFDIITEIKPRSPAEGEFAQTDPMELLGAYEAGGAGMISVLTEPDAFSGSIGLLSDVAEQATVPVMRKDFLVDPYQVFEARAAGADGVLLIVRILDQRSLEAMLDAVAETEMFALIEAFDGRDLVRALGVLAYGGDLLVGVNGRDLTTLDVDRSIHVDLAAVIAGRAPAVAESGIRGPDDIREVARLGYRAALVGSALMRSEEPRRAVEAMVAAGRETVGAGSR